MTAILRGGPFDSIVFEIEEGQTEISAKADLFTGQPPPEATYKYTGVIDAERNAVFEIGEPSRSS
ncbi:MAG: hypothetical protein ACRDJY_07685 [Thermoleophilaceae bacterium]